MGKYMRKAKTAGEVAVMDVSQSSLGVRTRAKTLALQKSSVTSSPPPANSGSYLQLRSRRLKKPPILVSDSSKRTKQSQAKERDGCHQNHNQNQNPNSNNSRTRVRVSQTDSGSRGSQKKESNDINVKKVEVEEGSNKDLGIEASFGDNVLDFEGRERSTRESTPCSLIRDPETIRTPGSTTRPTSSMESRGVRNSTPRHIPTTHEMDQFFTGAEEEQQRQFVEKYNFDPVNDKPLPGRFEWEKVNL